MRVLLSTIVSRGDVQLVLALALQLEDLQQEVRICAPPDFRESIEALGIPFFPVGPEARPAVTANSSAARAVPSPEQMRQLMDDTIADQFKSFSKAAEGCDVLVAGMALQFALRSVSELM